LDLAIAISRTAGPRQGLAELDQIPEAHRSGDYYLARAQMLDGEGKPDEALTALEHALAAAPKRADLYQQAALFLTRQRRAPEAVRLLDQASRVLPDNPKIPLVKAAILAAIPKPGEAEQVLKKIQNRWPEWASSYVTYGILLEGQKRAQEAKAQLETAASLGASGPEEFLYLARATLDATPERIDDASKAIQQAVAMAPEDPQVQAVAGRIDYQNHDYNGAVQHLTKAIRLRPGYIQARFTLAQAYRALGRKDDALRESQEFQRLRDQNVHAEDDF
jgi:tetratricopeptide (TPR) repeat protein